VNRATSTYLDLVRLLAAVAVLVTHLAYPRFTGGLLLEWRTYGNDAVMVFFVLSGYVIAHTVATRDRDFRSYLIHRCARLYSVALPAIALTLLLDGVGRAIDPAMYDGFWYQSSDPVLRVLRAASFTNELWFDSVRLFTNGPYWSLGYEFWYYLIFAAACFLRGAPRTATIGGLALVVGPKILLLLPVWLLGVWVHRVNLGARIGRAAGWFLFAGSFVLYALFRALGWRDALLAWTWELLGKRFVEGELMWSNEFLAAYAIGALVAANFIGLHAVAGDLAPLLARHERRIRDWAGYTFSIYLFHYPVLQFLAALLPIAPRAWWSAAMLLILTLLTCRLLGTCTEQRKDLARALVTALADRLVPRR
jgi:peptidoglycan/LPS O-acetylase OafA/YrhL